MSDNQIPQRPRTVGILIFDEVEVLDFCGPFEVFASAHLPDHAGDDERLFHAVIIAERPDIVHCRGNLLVTPHYTIENHPALDLLIVPGGRGTRRERTNETIIAWIKAQAAQTEITASVCTGAFLLGAAGLLRGRQATTHWGSIDWLREHHPEATVNDAARWVDEGRIVTSAGVSAGIDMSLYLVERLHGRAAAETTARHMEYTWQRELV